MSCAVYFHTLMDGTITFLLRSVRESPRTHLVFSFFSPSTSLDKVRLMGKPTLGN